MNFKLSFDLLTLEVFYRENYERLKNSLVEKVYQIGNTEVFFNLYSLKEGKFTLSLSVHPQLYRIQLTKKDLPYPSSPPPFAMFLRKHLEGAKIIDWYLVPQERIVEFTFQRLDESKKKLIVELMGKYSNIVLVNESNVILDAIKHVSSEKSRFREILPGEIYLYPPKSEKISLLNITEENIEKILDKEKPVKEVLLKDILYINPLLSEEMVRNIKDKSYKFLNLEEKEEVKREILKFKEKIINKNFQFSVYFLNNNPYTFSVFNLEIFKDLKKKEFKTLTDIIDYIYSFALESSLLEQLKRKLKETIESNLEKVKEKKEEFLEKIREGESAEIFKIKGETLILYQKEINKGLKKVLLPNPYAENEMLEIELDPSLSAIDSAQKYFKRYKKLKRGISVLKEQLEKIEEEIFYLNSLELALENSNNIIELQEIEEELINGRYIREKKERKKSKKKSEPYKFILPSGYEVYVGKNNKQNDYLTFNLAGPEDLWFHARGIPGAHTILKLKLKEKIPQEIIEEVASLAGYFSKGRNSTYVAVDYTKRKYVQKPKEGKPGFVVYRNEKTIFVKPEKALEFISQLV